MIRQSSKFCEFRFFFLVLTLISQESTLANCPEKKWNGMSIPETFACQTATSKCPNNQDGVITWTCDCEHAKWSETPDFTDCVSHQLQPLKQLVTIGEEPLNVMRRFQAGVFELLDSGNLGGGDVIAFVESADELLARVHQVLNNRSQSAKWQESYAQEFCQLVGDVGDRLLDEKAEVAWLQLTDDLRIDRAARLMTLLQNILVIRGTGMQAGANATMRFTNYEGQVLLKQASPLAADMPMIINRAMRIGDNRIPSNNHIRSEKIQFEGVESTMQLPSSDLLSSLAPHFALPTMFLAHGRNGQATRPPKNQELPPVKLGYFTYSTLGRLMTNLTAKSRVNSPILGAFVNDPVLSVNLQPGMAANFTFKHLVTDGTSNASCVYWDVMESRWATDGCTLIQTNHLVTKCSCTHLTSFAVLMDFSDSLAIYNAQPGRPASSVVVALDVLTIVGCTISIVCLVVCVVVFTVFRSLHSNIRVTIHRNLCISLLFGELFFLFGIDRSDSPQVCRLVAVALHYFFICAFAWMLLEGYQLYLMLIKVFESSRSRTASFYLFGFGFPALLVLASFLLEPKNYGTDDYCWINVRTPTIWAFLGPILCIVLFNSSTLAVAFKKVLCVQNRDRGLALRVLGWLKGSLTLFCLLGVTWIFGFLTAVRVFQPFFAFVFTILNSLQGAFIFVLHVCCNEKAQQAIRRCLRKGVCCSTPLSDSSQQASSSFNPRSNNFLGLKKIGLLEWWPLKSRSSSSSGSSQKNSRDLGVRFKPVAVIHQLGSTDNEEEFHRSAEEEKHEEDEQVTRKRLLTSSPQSEVTVERF